MDSHQSRPGRPAAPSEPTDLVLRELADLRRVMLERLGALEARIERTGGPARAAGENDRIAQLEAGLDMVLTRIRELEQPPGRATLLRRRNA